jgi:FAD-dependent urate hydroxylase
MELYRARRQLVKALVIGGGIAGPVLGMWLRRIGAEVVIAEARPQGDGGEGAFLGVAPNGMNVLAALGIADRVAARGVACTGFAFANAAGRSIGVIDRSEDPRRFGAALTMIRRADLHDVLLSEAERAGVELRFGVRLHEVDAGAEGVRAAFEDGTSEDADILVGADGIGSTVRRLCFPAAPAPAFSGLLDVGGFARGVSLPVAPAVNHMVFGRRAFFGVFVPAEGAAWWFHNGPPPPSHEPAAELRLRLLELHAGDPAWIRACIEATPRLLGPWPLREIAGLERWTEERVALVGDAAHAMSPSAGQGASMAMEDAMVLAMCLRDVGDPAAALRAFERARRARVEATARIARRNSSGKAPPGAVAAWVRDRMLPIFLRIGAAAQERGYGYRIAWDVPV